MNIDEQLVIFGLFLRVQKIVMDMKGFIEMVKPLAGM